MTSNPYGSDASSADIKSNIIGLALTDGNGEPINVAGKELQMMVKRDAGKDTAQPAVNQFSETATMNFHRFNYSSLLSGVSIEVRPVDSKLSLK